MSRSTIGIVASRADEASMAIRDALLDRPGWTRADEDGRYRRDGFELQTFDRLHLDLESVGGTFESPAAVLFISRHAGETGPLLTTHVPGNVGEAAFGGSPHSLPSAAPALMQSVFRGLQRAAPEGYDVALECTHHGPSAVGAPTLFVEIGSGPDQWTDPAAADAVASAVLGSAGVDPRAGRTVVGFGGGHYAPRFRRIVDETDWRVGHIAADWALDELDDDALRDRVVERAIVASAADVALVDGDRPDIVDRIAATGTPIISETWLREADGVALPVVEWVEREIGPIAEGTRMGEVSVEDATALEVATLPDALVDILNGHVAAAALDVVRASTVAYRTAEGGNRLAGTIVLDGTDELEDLIDALRPLLEDAFASVSREGDVLVLEETVFDPSAARAMGVPEGPAFGRLANGEAVAVDGDRVEPSDVMREDTIRIAVTPD